MGGGDLDDTAHRYCGLLDLPMEEEDPLDMKGRQTTASAGSLKP